MREPVATVQVRWLKPTEGGRARLPNGSTYAATAHFVGDGVDDSFSIVLRWSNPLPSDDPERTSVELRLLAPENLPEVVNRLVPEAELVITEGGRTVADGRIVSVRMEETQPG